MNIEKVLCTDPDAGFRLAAGEGRLKCYMGDTGPPVSHALADAGEGLEVQRALQFGRVFVNRGMLVENCVAQQLRAC